MTVTRGRPVKRRRDWLARQLRDAARTVAAWPAWKRRAMRREATRDADKIRRYT